MNYLAIILVTTIVITTTATADAFGTVDELIDSYARTKLWESCVGGDLAREWEKRVDEVAQVCRHGKEEKPTTKHPQISRENRNTFLEQSVAPYHLGLRNNPRNHQVFVTNSPRFGGNHHFFNVPLTANRRADRHPLIPTARRADGVQPVWFTLFDQIPIIIQPGPSSHNSGTQSRMKRQTGSSKGTQFEMFLQNMVDSERSVRERLANFTCVLQSLNLVDNRGDLNFQVMEKSTRNSALDVELRNDFMAVLDDCTRLSRCESYKSHVVPANLQRAFNFLKCARDRRQMACLKKDLRRYLRENLTNNVAGQVVDLEDMVDRIFYVTMAEMGHREIKSMLLV